MLTRLWSLIFPSAFVFSTDMALANEGKTVKNFDPVLAEAWEIPSNIDFLDVSERLSNSLTGKQCTEALKSGRRKIYLFHYPSDGLRIKGYISFVPDKKLQAPVLFFLRGGNRWFGLMNPANDFSCYGPYTVIGLSYRDSVSPGVDQFGGDDVADVKNLIDYFPTLAKRFGIATNSNRYLLGVSRGGMQMFLALSRYQTLHAQFKSVMSLSGVLDLASWVEERPDMTAEFRSDFGLTKKNQQLWIAYRNPLTNINNIARGLPILIVQGGKDGRVNVREGKKMAAELIAQGFHSVTHKLFPNANHTLQNITDDVKTIWRLFGEER